MNNWKLGQYVRIWKNEGYEYAHVQILAENESLERVVNAPSNMPVMLVGDDGKEIYCCVKDLEEG